MFHNANHSAQAGKSIFVRSIDDPSLSKQYTSHTATTTVARFSPSGYYIASGDVSGTVRVWDAIEAVNTKGEYHIISGRINDIAWDGDSQRIIAVGDGRERFGHCITADSGNSVGEISGHSQVVNSVAIRQQRPLRAATGSDDMSMCFLNGAPFKFANKVSGVHKGYIYGTAFSPDGNHLVTVGADKRIQLYDGKTGEPTKQIGEGEHKGSIFAVSWASDSKRFVTASADQTVKVWDVESGKAVQSWSFGEGNVSVPDQQVGVVWPAGRKDGLIISLNLAGDLNYLVEGQATPIKVVQGHNRNITAIGKSGVFADEKQTLWTGSFDGRVCSWDLESGTGSAVEGQTHTNQVIGFTDARQRMYSVGWDDTVRMIDTSTNIFLGSTVQLSGQPKGVDEASSRIHVATVSSKGCSIQRFEHDMQPAGEFPIQYTPTCIAGTAKWVAVADDANIVHIYKATPDDRFTEYGEAKLLTNSTSQITTLSFTMGGLLAVGHSSGKILAYDIRNWEVEVDRWSAHTAKVTSIAWNPREPGKYAVSGSLDTHIHVWSVKNPGKRIKASNAHKEGVNGVAWVDENTIASVGADGAVKIWEVKGLE